jgi:hypothetical protein
MPESVDLQGFAAAAFAAAVFAAAVVGFETAVGGGGGPLIFGGSF